MDLEGNVIFFIGISKLYFCKKLVGIPEGSKLMIFDSSYFFIAFKS